MKLFLVERTDKVFYDEYSGHVVLAKSAGQARQLCAEKVADEHPAVWRTATTQIIGYPHPLLGKEPKIILSDFNAG